MNIKQILEGWKNTLLPSKELKKKIVEVSKIRKEICESCEYHSKNTGSIARIVPHCTLCKCPITSKVACLSCSCALANADYYGVKDQGPKWIGVISEDEEFEIDSSKDFNEFSSELNKELNKDKNG